MQEEKFNKQDGNLDQPNVNESLALAGLFKLKTMKKLLVWYRATFLNYPFYRVTYRDGKRTHALYYAEAKGLRDVFNGEMKIDYEYGLTYFNR